MTKPYDTGHATHTGLVRARNEDSLACLPDRGLFIVADGMGGMAAGDVASRMAVATMETRLGLGAGLLEAVVQADLDIAAAAAENRDLAGMGTTVVALATDGRDFELAWVGDSRIYRLGDHIDCLTHDHSLVQALVDDGIIEAREARAHPQRNIITRVVGALGGEAALVGRRRGRVSGGDALLLCTDGLHGLVDDEEIFRVARDAGNAREAADALVQAALDAGGIDNVSVIVVRIA